jgi:plastocyanin
MGMSVRIAALLTGSVAALSIAFAVGAPAARAATHEVTMANYSFGPTALTVHVGDSVTWTNRDTAPHDITTTTAPVAIHSPTLTKGKSWTYLFTSPGTYRYICSIHPDMIATVTVLPAPKAPTTTAAPTRATAAPVRSSSARSSVVTRTSTSPVRTAAPVAAGSPGPTTSVAALPVGSTADSTTKTNRLKPLLLLAGLAAAVATLCLLMLASRPDST